MFKLFGKDWDILLGINAKSLPVSVRDICNYLKIRTLSYRNAEEFVKETDTNGKHAHVYDIK